MNNRQPWQLKKIKIVGAVLELPAKQQCQFSPFAVNMLNWLCCLTGSSKTAPRILIFFQCHGCQYFILCEIHCYLCPHIFWIYYFSLSHSDSGLIRGSELIFALFDSLDFLAIYKENLKRKPYDCLIYPKNPVCRKNKRKQ